MVRRKEGLEKAKEISKEGKKGFEDAKEERKKDSRRREVVNG